MVLPSRRHNAPTTRTSSSSASAAISPSSSSLSASTPSHFSPNNNNNSQQQNPARKPPPTKKNDSNNTSRAPSSSSSSLSSSRRRLFFFFGPLFVWMRQYYLGQRQQRQQLRRSGTTATRGKPSLTTISGRSASSFYSLKLLLFLIALLVIACNFLFAVKIIHSNTTTTNNNGATTISSSQHHHHHQQHQQELSLFQKWRLSPETDNSIALLDKKKKEDNFFQNNNNHNTSSTTSTTSTSTTAIYKTVRSSEGRPADVKVTCVTKSILDGDDDALSSQGIPLAHEDTSYTPAVIMDGPIHNKDGDNGQDEPPPLLASIYTSGGSFFKEDDDDEVISNTLCGNTNNNNNENISSSTSSSSSSSSSSSLFLTCCCTVTPLIMSKKALERMTGNEHTPLPEASTSFFDSSFNNNGNNKKKKKNHHHQGFVDDLPLSVRQQRVVYFITPTYNRDSQMVDMTRLMQMLQLAVWTQQVGLLYWIVVEDALEPSLAIRQLLEQSGLCFSHTARRTIQDEKRNPQGGGISISGKNNKGMSRFRGVEQRNHALAIIRDVVNAEGVIYFGDDDNAYDVSLITELTRTRRVSIFNVAFSAKAAYERCHVDHYDDEKEEEKSASVSANAPLVVTGIHTPWKGGRKFPMDMGGFAFTTSILMEKQPKFHTFGQRGRLETLFLQQMVSSLEELEPLAAYCQKMLVWHVKAEKVVHDNDNDNDNNDNDRMAIHRNSNSKTEKGHWWWQWV